ncbi:hypothetical protein RF11_08352 [Thelohanellus kitauei]|uniref:Uncharacterized protein n=1 Tax=Thelohanellus kitauei TaxID=669202 RepID=A0A0C2MBL1_THEKT|nr:hypothetical protein RF11_08352 [Thelohanellus kitauei]
MSFKNMKNWELQYKFWKEGPNYFLFYFQELYEHPDALKQVLYASRDGGKTLGKWKPAIGGKRLYIEQFIPIKHVLFGKSGINRTFFYADRKFHIFSSQRLERNETAFPSEYNPSCIYKLVKKGPLVS